MRRITFAVFTMGMLLMSQPAWSAIEYDQDITDNVIMGTGIANNISWTTDRRNGIELGLRAKLRFDGTGQPQNTFNSNGDGTYSFAAGIAPTKVFPRAIWAFEWSINSDYHGNGDNPNLIGFTYLLSRDSDPSWDVNFTTTPKPQFDPIATGGDHSIGTNDTGESAGAEATSEANYIELVTDNNLAQNSWQPHWPDGIGDGFDPTIDATYDFLLQAFDVIEGETVVVAATSIQVIVGEGGAVPEPVSLIVWSLLGTAAITVGRRRYRRAA